MPGFPSLAIRPRPDESLACGLAMSVASAVLVSVNLYHPKAHSGAPLAVLVVFLAMVVFIGGVAGLALINRPKGDQEPGAAEVPPQPEETPTGVDG